MIVRPDPRWGALIGMLVLLAVLFAVAAVSDWTEPLSGTDRVTIRGIALITMLTLLVSAVLIAAWGLG